MKKTLALALLYSSLSVNADCTSGEVIVSGKDSYPPISYNKEGELAGIGYLAIEEILKTKKIKTKKTQPMPWKRAIDEASVGNIDFIIGLRQTTERLEKFKFIKTPLIESAQNVFFRKGENINSKQDLISLRGGGLDGTNFSDKFDKFAKNNLKISYVRTLQQNILKLRSGRIDYFIAPLLPTIQHITENKIKIDIGFMPTPLFMVPETIAISNKSDCITLLDTIDNELKKLHDTGFIETVFDEIIVEWDILNFF